MRETLTILGCLIVALLTAALAGPYFVDWTAQRAHVEARLAETLGTRVVTRGAIDLVLLPTPRLALDGIETGEAAGVSLRSGRLRLELAVGPLMRGEFRFLEASFEEPEISISLGSDGAKASNASRLPAETQFERIVLRNGRVRFVEAGAREPRVIEGLDLEAEASSLVGPFRGAGSFRHGAEKVGFRFTTGAGEGDRMRLKLVSDETASWPRADLDGSLIVTRAAGGRRIHFEGQSNFSGRALAGWRVSGPAKIESSGLAIDPLDARIGGDEASLGLSGVGVVGFGAGGRAQFTLSARQFDFDRLLQLGNASASELVALPARWIADAHFSERAGMPWRLALTTPALTIGGETLTEVAIDARAEAGAPVLLRIDGFGPGRSRLSLDGKLETGAAARFDGKVEAGARDVVRLADWVAQASPEAAARLRAIPFRLVEASGEMTLSAAGVAARDLSLKADRSILKGSLAFTRGLGGARARFYADMRSDALDLDAIPDLTVHGAAFADTDLSLALEARAVRVARLGDGMVDSGRIRLRLARSGDALKLETLSLADIGGASLEASGDSDARRARVTAHLDARRLGDLAGLLQRVAPGPWTQALSARAVALSPARLDFSLDAVRASGADPLRLASVRVNGSARGTKVEASVRPDANGAFGGLLLLEAPDASQLVRQIGFEALPLIGGGNGRITAELKSAPDGGLEATALARLAGTQLSFFGAVAGSPTHPRVSGQARVGAADAGPFLRMMAFGSPDYAAALPIDLGARFSLADGRAEFATLMGTLAGARVSGDLKVAPEASAAGRPRVTGSLALDSASLPALAAIVLGPPALARPGARWADAKFAEGLVDAPLAEVAVKASRAELLDGVATRDAAFVFGLGPGVLRFDDLTAKLGDATLSGRIAVRRDGATAALSGSLGLAGARIDQRSATARLEGRVEFTSTGQSVAGLVTGLAGSGRVRSQDLIIPRADPRGPSRVVAQADDGQIYVSENDFVGALRRELDKAPFVAGAREFEANLTAGVLRLSEPGGVSASLDLRDLTHEIRVAFGAEPLPKDWKGAAPRLSVVWKGPLAAPNRDLDAGAFINALSARAIAREAARVEALEADIRERAFFERRRKGLAFLRQREREIVAWEVEQARLAAEAERRRIEEERRAIEEERRRIAAELARIERERRAAAEARRREDEAAARAAQQTPLRLPIVPGMGVDPSAAGRY